MIRLAAFDLSLTHTGWAVVTQPEPALSGAIVPKHAGMDRLKFIRDHVVAIARETDVTLVEGYSFGSKGRAVFQLGELGGVIRLALHERTESQVVEVAPSTLKKYATGKGNASKDEVLAAAIRRLEYDGHDNNVADALWLLEMALHWYASDYDPRVPKTHHGALTSVEWPKVNGRA